MKLKDTDKAALLVLFGILVCVASFLFVFRPNYETKQSLDAESAELEIRLADLQSKEADREMYEAKTVEYEEKYDTVMNAFPPDLNQEITIMFLEGIKESNEFTIATLGLGEKYPFYTLGSNGSEVTLDESADSSEDDTEETGTSDDTGASDALVEDSGSAEGSLVCYTASFPLEYSGSYNSLKDVVEYVNTYSDRMTVDSLSITYDDGAYVGEIELFCYSIEGEGRPPRSLDMNQVETGVENIFEGTAGVSSSDGIALNKYDDNDGSAIETSYDFYAMLNASTSDVSAKVLGQNGTGKENTVLSDSNNTVSTVTYDIYEVDGKNYCKYTLDNDQSYEAEITSAEDMKIFIQSSERKNEDDKVGVKITIRNSTSLPVYVKVSGDDAVAPRVTISKTGAVKVYQ